MRTTKFIAVIICVAMAAAGCVTTGKRQEGESQQLQSRISDLETELESKNREIAELERALSEQPSPVIVREAPVSAPKKHLTDKEVQTALKKAGFYAGPIDGKIGKKTKAAIAAFQKARGLTADGVIGRKTRAELIKFLNN